MNTNPHAGHSHHSREDVGANRQEDVHGQSPMDAHAQGHSREAPAGSIIAMDGRVWHTSGANITTDEERPLLFAYYTRAFLRPQWNFSVSLRPEVQASLDRTMRYRLGLDIALNVGLSPRLGQNPTAATS